MRFNKHSNLEGCHAILSASKYHWLNYDDDKMEYVLSNIKAAERGTIMHDYACRSIKLGQKLPRSNKTLNMYVNDAIGFKMSPEVTLYYSQNCYGTADSILFRDGTLRIHDYKTGRNPAKLDQLRIYAALFCLEYKKNPEDLSAIILRIYQNDDILEEIAEPAAIRDIMKKIIHFDELINKLDVPVTDVDSTEFEN